MSEHFEMQRTMRFEAAHHLPHAPPDHKCHRIHGHSFAVEVTLSGGLSEPEGWIMDFAQLGGLLDGVHDTLDHRLLNDLPGLANPTSEELARWIWRRLAGQLPPAVTLSKVTIRETCQSAVSYRTG